MLLFKSDNLEQEFEKVDNRLKVLLYTIAGMLEYMFGKDFTITGLFRDDHKSVHHTGRGADGSVANLNEEEGDAVVDFINSKFLYGKRGKLTIFDEREEVGPNWTGPHLHIQVNNYATTFLNK